MTDSTPATAAGMEPAPDTSWARTVEIKDYAKDAAATRATGAIVPPEVACRCVSDCDRDGDAAVSCRHCRMRIDPAYDPCPRLGFGCGMGAKQDTTPCDCCTPEQWQAASAS